MIAQKVQGFSLGDQLMDESGFVDVAVVVRSDFLKAVYAYGQLFHCFSL